MSIEENKSIKKAIEDIENDVIDAQKYLEAVKIKAQFIKKLFAPQSIELVYMDIDKDKNDSAPAKDESWWGRQEGGLCSKKIM